MRALKPKFKPGQKGKVYYSDTNYQLLGKIIESITGMSMSDVFRTYIFNELQLTKTYVFEDVNDVKPVPLYYKENEINLPNYMASVTTEGGIVSTAKETMIFLRAFFRGRFFSTGGISRTQAVEANLFSGSIFFTV